MVPNALDQIRKHLTSNSPLSSGHPKPTSNPASANDHSRAKENGERPYGDHPKPASSPAAVNGDSRATDQQQYGDLMDQQFMAFKQMHNPISFRINPPADRISGVNQNNLINVAIQLDDSPTDQVNQALLRDPRTRSRSVSGALKKSTTPVTMQSFDVRSLEKPTSIKYFSKHNLLANSNLNAPANASSNVSSNMPRNAPPTPTTPSPSTTAVAPEMRSRRALFDANNNEVAWSGEMPNLDDDDDFVESGLVRRSRDYSPDYRKKREHQQETTKIQSDFEYYEEPRRARRSKVPCYRPEDYIPDGVLITTESLRSHTRALNNQRSVVEAESITREEAIRRINEGYVDSESDVSDDYDYSEPVQELDPELNLDNVTITRSNEEAGSKFALEKLTRLLALKAASAVPAAFCESESVPAGFFVPAIMSKREKNVNFVNEDEIKSLDNRINYKIELKRFAKEHNLPEPEFDRPVYIDNNMLGGYSSKLKIGDKSWFTVLGKHQAPDLADNCVSKRALEELKEIVVQQEQADKQEDELISKIVKVGHWSSTRSVCRLRIHRANSVSNQLSLSSAAVQWQKRMPIQQHAGATLHRGLQDETKFGLAGLDSTLSGDQPVDQRVSLALRAHSNNSINSKNSNSFVMPRTAR